MSGFDGKCPNCELPGMTGDACREDSCSRKRYHYIPRTHGALEETAADPLIGIPIDEYLPVRKAGQGGFGVVYEVLQLPILLKAALKLLSFESSNHLLSQSLRRKFEIEARSLAKLFHPNIVRLLKYGMHEQGPYLVMEYVEQGRSLRAEIETLRASDDTMAPTRLYHLVHQALNALQSAHQHQIIHRDIKPENIMLQRVTGDDDFVRILDFGLAKFIEERDCTSVVTGTPGYMAPEQFSGTDLGPWTDLYAMATILFEILFGRRPGGGETPAQVYEQRLTSDEGIVPCENFDRAPASVQAFFRRALAPIGAARFGDVGSFRHAFEHLRPEIEGLDRSWSMAAAPDADQQDALPPLHDQQTVSGPTARHRGRAIADDPSRSPLPETDHRSAEVPSQRSTNGAPIGVATRRPARPEDGPGAGRRESSRAALQLENTEISDLNSTRDRRPWIWPGVVITGLALVLSVWVGVWTSKRREQSQRATRDNRTEAQHEPAPRQTEVQGLRDAVAVVPHAGEHGRTTAVADTVSPKTMVSARPKVSAAKRKPANTGTVATTRQVGPEKRANMRTTLPRKIRRILVTSSPAKVSLFIGPRLLGVTPYRLELTSPQRVTLRASKRGYKTRSITIGGDAATTTLRVTLKSLNAWRSHPTYVRELLKESKTK